MATFRLGLLFMGCPYIYKYCNELIVDEGIESITDYVEKMKIALSYIRL